MWQNCLPRPELHVAEAELYRAGADVSSRERIFANTEEEEESQGNEVCDGLGELIRIGLEAGRSGSLDSDYREG